MYLIGRTRLMMTQEDLYRMTMGTWDDMFHEFRQIYNFEARRALYPDIEEENREIRTQALFEDLKRRPVASVSQL